MKKQKVDNSGQIMATIAQMQAQQAAETLRKNMAADLSNENLTTTVAGGTAEAADAAVIGSTTRKRKNAAGGLASQLGVDV